MINGIQIPVPMNPTIHEFRIKTKRARESWQLMTGINITNTVRVTHDYYLRHINEIHEIQMLDVMLEEKILREVNRKREPFI